MMKVCRWSWETYKEAEAEEDFNAVREAEAKVGPVAPLTIRGKVEVGNSTGRTTIIINSIIKMGNRVLAVGIVDKWDTL